MFYCDRVFVAFEMDMINFCGIWAQKILNKECEEQKYGQFVDISKARRVCINARNCSGVLDVNCGSTIVSSLPKCEKRPEFARLVGRRYVFFILGIFYSDIKKFLE